VTLDLPALAADVAALDEYARRRPLAVWRAWGDPERDLEAVAHGGRTTQRRALRALESSRTVIVFGGNRSGKTECLRAALVALACGSDHPDARAFWRANGCDPDAFPRGPGRVWSITRTSNDSIRYNRKQILALVPKWGPAHTADPRGNWYAWNLEGRGESRIEWMVPGYDTPAEVWFKSEDQESDSFDGDAIRAAHHDEEGKTPKVWDQVYYRLTDHDGWQLFSNAPIKGKTWVYERFERNNDPRGPVGLVRLSSIDNPYLPRRRALALDRDPIRGHGLFASAKGRIWPMFSRVVHVLPVAIAPLLQGPRFRVIDFGTRHPHACLWAVVLRSAITLPGGRRIPDRSAIVYREHYQAGWTLAQHVARYRALEGDERFEATWADPEDAQQILSLNRDHGISAMKGNKAREAGFNAVGEWLTPDDTGAPRLYVLDSCVETIREWEDYVEIDDKVNAEGVPTHTPSGRSDHTCDCARYLVMGLINYM
jgi:hypothetical protein